VMFATNGKKTDRARAVAGAVAENTAPEPTSV